MLQQLICLKSENLLKVAVMSGIFTRVANPKTGNPVFGGLAHQNIDIRNFLTTVVFFFWIFYWYYNEKISKKKIKKYLDPF